MARPIAGGLFYRRVAAKEGVQQQQQLHWTRRCRITFVIFNYND